MDDLFLSPSASVTLSFTKKKKGRGNHPTSKGDNLGLSAAFKHEILPGLEVERQ